MRVDVLRCSNIWLYYSNVNKFRYHEITQMRVNTRLYYPLFFPLLIPLIRRDVVLGTCTCTRVVLEYKSRVLVLVLVLEG